MYLVLFKVPQMYYLIYTLISPISELTGPLFSNKEINVSS